MTTLAGQPLKIQMVDEEPVGGEARPIKIVGEINFAGGEIKNYTENVVEATVGATYEIALDGSIYWLTLTDDTVFSFSGEVGGSATVNLSQDGIGSHAPTYPGITWPSGTAHTMTATASARDKLVFDKPKTNVVDGQIVGQDYA